MKILSGPLLLLLPMRYFFTSQLLPMGLLLLLTAPSLLKSEIIFYGPVDSGCIEYDAAQNSINIRGFIGKVANLYQLSFSPNKNWVIYSAIKRHEEPELFKVRKGGCPVQLTDNEFIEFDPVINSQGDYAYALSENSTSQSKVFFNTSQITDEPFLYKHLALSDEYLAIACEIFSSRIHELVLYHIPTGSLTRTPIDGYIQKIRFLTENLLIIEIYNPHSLSFDVVRYDINTNLFQGVRQTEYNEFIYSVTYGSGFSLVSVTGSDNSRRLFNALYAWSNFQVTNPFAESNDYLGRLSWNLAYRLEGLICLYKITNHPVFRTQIQKSSKSVLASRNSRTGFTSQFNPPDLWASRKYSIDHTTSLSLQVNNARIIYPLLVAARLGIVDTACIVGTAETMYEYFENFYDPLERSYHFQKQMNYSMDGIWLPFNEQNTFGLVLLELYKITGKMKYCTRVHELAVKFKSEFHYTADDRLFWHYWPQSFYNGWDTGDSISTNMTSRVSTIDSLYEDISHAGLNIKFLLEHYNYFGDTIFNLDDLQKLSNTVDGFIFGNTLSRFMSGDTIYQVAEALYFPNYGWPELGHSDFNRFSLNMRPNVYPDFDSHSLVSSLSPLGVPSSLETVDLKKISFTTNLEVQDSLEASECFSRITELFEFLRGGSTRILPVKRDSFIPLVVPVTYDLHGRIINTKNAGTGIYFFRMGIQVEKAVHLKRIGSRTYSNGMR